VIRLGIVSTELRNLGADAPAGVLAMTASDKRVRWFELALVLVIAFGGSFLSSLYLMKAGKAAIPMVIEFRWARGFVQEIPCLFLLWYVLSRRRRSFRDIGLRWSVRDVGVGLGLTLVSYLAYMVGGFIVYFLHHALFPQAANGVSAADLSSHSLVAAIPFALINPFFEELIVRAYLMTEVKALTGSWFLASISSVAIQWSYHLYYGWDGSLSIAFTFLAFSIYFARTQRATPVVVAHGVLDIWAVLWWK
jgi:membrane protease YdiL (CAAX protease family)